GALDGEGDVGRRRLLLLDVQSQASEEFPHSRATPWQLTAKGFAACQEIPPGHHLLAPKLRETPFYPGDDTMNSAGMDSALTEMKNARPEIAILSGNVITDTP